MAVKPNPCRRKATSHPDKSIRIFGNSSPPTGTSTGTLMRKASAAGKTKAPPAGRTQNNNALTYYTGDAPGIKVLVSLAALSLPISPSLALQPFTH